MNLSNIEIVSKLLQTILQSRMDVKKSQFKKFQSILKDLEGPKPFGCSILLFLSELITFDLYNIKSKLNSKILAQQDQTVLNTRIYFTLTERSTGDRIDAEVWEIDLLSKRTPTIGKANTLNADKPLLIDKSNASSRPESEELFELITGIFKSLIVFLNKKPLFSMYQKDKELKSRFILDYKIVFEKSPKLDKTLFDLECKELILKENAQISLSLGCYYLPSLHHLKKTGFIQEQKINRKESMSLSDYETDRKVSVYAFYDPTLDFTFLSSDDESLRSKSKELNKTEQISIDAKNQDDSQQFELMMVNQDEEFLHENKGLFEALNAVELEHYQRI